MAWGSKLVRSGRGWCLLPCLVWSLPVQAALGKAEGKILQIGVVTELEAPHPLLSKQAATTYLSGLVSRHLLSMDVNGELQPDLLAHLPKLREDIHGPAGERKGVSVALVLRADAKWGDGKPITAYDIQFSWRLGVAFPPPGAEGEVYDNISNVSVDDEDSKKLKLTCRSFTKKNLVDLMHLRIIPHHVEEAVYLQNNPSSDNYKKHSYYTLQPNLFGLYNGPFRVSEFVHRNQLVLERNPFFYGSRPLLDKIVIQFLPHLGDIEEHVRTGRLHLIASVGLDQVQASILAGAISRHNLNWQMLAFPSLIYEHIDMKLSHPILMDLRVRKALHYGLDKEGMVQRVAGGKFYVAHHFLSPADSWYTDDATKIFLYPYQPDKAKQLLAEAGWQLQRDGYRWKDGKKLQLQLISNEESPYRGGLLSLLKEQWLQLGIDLQTKLEPAAIFFAETVKKSRFSSMVLFAWKKSSGYLSRDLMQSSRIPSAKNAFAGENIGQWLNPKVDLLLENLEGEWDGQKRRELAHQVLKWYTQELPAIPLFFRGRFAFVSKKVSGYHISGHETPETFASEFWDLQGN